jgi:hypothetical protein
MTTLKRYIREGRMGPPLTYKTGAVVETYPKPMLVFEFDKGGLDVVKQPITMCDVPISAPTSNIIKLCATPTLDLPAITAIDFAATKSRDFNLAYIKQDSTPLVLFNDVFNAIVQHGCPWKTVVLDPVTGLVDAIVSHIGMTQSKAMEDARRWAYMAGQKVEQTIAVVQGLPCHTVFIMHSTEDKNELTSEIKTLPMIPSAIRERIQGLFSQFFYQVLEKGNPPKPFVLTQPENFVKAIGARWPSNLPAKCGATFQEIYGSEDKI